MRDCEFGAAFKLTQRRYNCLLLFTFWSSPHLAFPQDPAELLPLLVVRICALSADASTEHQAKVPYDVPFRHIEKAPQSCSKSDIFAGHFGLV